MFDRPSLDFKTILVHVFERSPEAREEEEFRALAHGAGAEIMDEVVVTRRRPDPRLYIGGGKVDEIAERAAATGAGLVIVNQELTPSQERNLEQRLGRRVLDRSGLILDIFAQRARSFEGKLQVELAQLEHLSTRLVRGWTHLERQKGGIGLRGPGETQLETDRRLLGERVKQLRKRLSKVSRQREQGREARSRADVPTVAVIGYTNAGKSTLFNALTGANAFAADQLFATLDPTLRRIRVGNGESAVCADTVGFVRELPHQLVAAFRATLTETREADLLIHVIDGADEHRLAHEAEVEDVLGDIGAESVPRLHVINKIDRMGLAPRLERGSHGRIERVFVSAGERLGLDLLRDALGERLWPDTVDAWLRLGSEAGKLRADLIERGAVRDDFGLADGGWRVCVRLPRARLALVVARADVRLEAIEEPRTDAPEAPAGHAPAWAVPVTRADVSAEQAD